MHDRKNWLQNLFPDNAERTVPWPAVGETVTLYRPTGLHELKLVVESGFRRWPPRLPDQPIFYPVLNFGCFNDTAPRKLPATGTPSAMTRLWAL